MNDKAICETIREIMSAYDIGRRRWMQLYPGDEQGYHKWFTEQVTGRKASHNNGGDDDE